MKARDGFRVFWSTSRGDKVSSWIPAESVGYAPTAVKLLEALQSGGAPMKDTSQILRWEFESVEAT